MASVTINKGTIFLIFTSVLHGSFIYTLFMPKEKEVKAAVGQNLSLQCAMFKENLKFIQLEWYKEDEQGVQKLVMFNPLFPLIYHANVTLEPVTETNTTKQLGSILHLQEVTEKDSGVYICDLTSFPDGSIKYSTSVQVTVPKVSVKVLPTDRAVIEGVSVNVTCVSDPPPDKYILSFLLSQSVMESREGEFRIHNITRDMSDMICRPLWNSSNKRLQNLNATVHLTVEYLDSIECNSESHIRVETKTNLTITCEAKSSRSLHFFWMKDNMTVCSGARLNLWSVRPDQSGGYTVMVQTGIKHLDKQKYFTVTVTNRTQTEHLSTTTIMETTSPITTTHEQTSRTSEAQHTTSTSEATSTEDMYISTSVPSTGNVTIVHVNATTHPGVMSTGVPFTRTSSEDSTARLGSSSRQIDYDTSTFIFTSGSTSRATGSNDLTKITGQGGSLTHAVVVIVPILLTLLLIGFLYRRYIIQKRLNRPPPFKPPPPPVKYISAINHDVHVTDVM